MTSKTTRQKKAESNISPDAVILGVLVYEFSFSSREESNRKIRARLKQQKLPFDEKRVALLRALKDELQTEISKGARSKYFQKKLSKKGKPRYVQPEDFDIPRMRNDMGAKYASIAERDMGCFVYFSVAVNYLL